MGVINFFSPIKISPVEFDFKNMDGLPIFLKNKISFEEFEIDELDSILKIRGVGCITDFILFLVVFSGLLNYHGQQRPRLHK